jgi:hypothetical protein
VLTVAASLLVVQAVSASPTCRSEIPANIRPGIFQHEMNRLLDRSETFREQCSRIAATRYLRVVFGVSRSVPDGSRAQTTIERFEAGAVVAMVTLKFAEDYMELIPHELEHVIEQLEHVRLADEESRQQAWRSRTGAYETRRAMAVGLRVRQEVMGVASVVEPAQSDRRHSPVPRHPLE